MDRLSKSKKATKINFSPYLYDKCPGFVVKIQDPEESPGLQLQNKVVLDSGASQAKHAAVVLASGLD